MTKKLKNLTIILITMFFVSYLIIQTGFAKKQLTSFISQQLSTSESIITLSRIKGHLPWNITINNITLTKRNKENNNDYNKLLVIENANLKWNPLSLIWGELHIESLSAENINWLERFPKLGKQAQYKQKLFIPKIAIGKMWLPNINIAAKLAGKQALALQFKIEGDASKPMHFKGDLSVKSGIPTNLSFDFKPNFQNDFLIDLQLNEAKGGLISNLLKLPQNQTIELKAKLSGNLQSINGDLRLLMQEKLIAELKLITDYANHLSLRGGGLIPDFIKLPNIITTKNWQISAGLKQLPNSTIVEDFSFDLSNINLQSSGNYIDETLSLSPKLNAIINNVNYEAIGELEANFKQNQFKLDMSGDFRNIYKKLIGDKAKITWKLKADGAINQPNAKLKLNATRLSLPQNLDYLNIGKSAELIADFTKNIGNLNLKAGEIEAIAQVKLNQSKINFNGDINHKDLPQLQFTSDFLPEKNQLNFNLTTNNSTFSLKDLKLNGDSGELELKSENIATFAAWLDLNFASNSTEIATKWTKDSINLNAKSEQFQFNDLLLNNFTAEVKNNNFKIKLIGENNSQQLNLDLSGEKKQKQYNLSELSANYSNYNFKLNSPSILTFNNINSWQLTPTKLNIDEGELNITAKRFNDEIALKLSLKPLSLQPLLADTIPNIGNISGYGEIEINGKATNPKLKLSAEINAADIAKSSLNNNAPNNLRLNVSGTNQADNLNIISELLSGSEQLGNAKISLPFILKFKPLQFSLPTTKPIKADAKLDLAASRFNNWFAPLGHRIIANINAQINATGSIGEPKITANINTTKLNYTNLNAGLCLRDGTLIAKYLGNQFILESLNGTGDLGVGTIKSSGIADFGKQFANFALTMDNAAIFCSTALDSSISGTAKLSGNFNDTMLKGDFLIGKTSILIPSGGKTNIPYVEKIYQHELNKRQLTIKNNPKISTNLNININAPKQIFVRGRGLDAEFAGKLQIIGNIINPKLIGKLTSKRGRLALLGSTLKIESGKINFINNDMKKPYIELLGSTKANNTKINVELSGAVLKPKLILTSDPALPKDEVLALLIFGKPLDRISPFQALQLATATASLTSGESGTSMLGELRDVLGVDNLNIGEGTDGQPTVGAGKYVTDKVYVGIEQGTTPESRRLSTEIELSPTVTGKTSTNSAGEPSFGLEWRYDY
jgi:autotransporter translocation and assembly factor TamB